MAWQAALLKGFKGVQTAKTIKGAIGGSKKKGGVSVKKERPKMGQFVKDVEQTKVEAAPKQKLVPTLALPQAAPPGEEKSKKIKEKISLLLKFVRERRALKEGRRKQKKDAQTAAKRKEEENKKENLSKGLAKGGKKIAGVVTRPVRSIWDNIMNAIGTIILAKVAMWVVDNPKLFATILKTLNVIGDVIANVTIVVLDIFAGVVEFGYKLVEGFEWLVGKTLGDDAAEKLEEWIPNITGFLNGAIILGQVMLAKALWDAKQVPGAGELPKPIKKVLRKWRVLFKKFLFKWKRRAIKLLRRLIKILGWGTRTVGRVIRETVKNARPLSRLRNLVKPITKPLQDRFGKPLQERIVKPLQNRLRKLNLGKKLQNIKPLETLRKLNLGKKLQNLNLGKNLSRIQPGKMLQAGGEKLSRFGGSVLTNIKKVPWKEIYKSFDIIGGIKHHGGRALRAGGRALKASWNFGVDFSKETLRQADNLVKNISGPLMRAVRGAQAWGAARVQGLMDLADEVNPQKQMQRLETTIKKNLQSLVDKNPMIKRIVGFMKNPKKAKGAVRGLVDRLAGNKTLNNLIKKLKGSSAAKALGPVDKVIAALSAAISYKMGESPINALVDALGGLVGYAGGLALSSLVPVLGQSGVFNLAAGLLGSWVGTEVIGKNILKALANTPLSEIEDPVMEDGRMLVRDPDGGMFEMKGEDTLEDDTSDLSDKKDQKPEPTSDNTTKVSSNDAKMNGVPSSSAQSVSTLNEGGSASGGGRSGGSGSPQVGDQAIIPLPVSQPASQGGSTVVVSSSEASLNNYKAQVQGQMYKS